MSFTRVNTRTIEGDTKLTVDGLNIEYIHRYLTKKQADELFDQLESELTYFSGDLARVKVFGKWHDIPRQQVAFGDRGLFYKFSGLKVPAQPWPQALDAVRKQIKNDFGHEYNFALVNRYRNGTDYMGEHRDDERELDEEPGILSLSLGQPRDFVFRHKDTKMRIRRVDNWTIRLGHGSALWMKHPTNQMWYHSLPQRKNQIGVRINLTFRQIVPETRS